MRVIVTPTQIILLAVYHIDMYESRLSGGSYQSPYTNTDETRILLNIWKSIYAKKGKDLTKEEETEIEDAVDSGMLDDIEHGR